MDRNRARGPADLSVGNRRTEVRDLAACGRRFLPTEPLCIPIAPQDSPSLSTGCARPCPHPGPFAAGRHALCSVCARQARTALSMSAEALNLQPSSKGSSPASSWSGQSAGYIGDGSLQHSRRQRAAGQPGPPPRRAGPAHPLQLSARDRYGRTEAEGLRPRRDRPPVETAPCSKHAVRISSS